MKLIIISMIGLGAFLGSSRDTYECGLTVSYSTETGYSYNCPDVDCDQGSGSCDQKAGTTPGGKTRIWCECTDGSKSECSTRVTIDGPAVTFSCLNPCAESCDQIPEIPDKPVEPCFCDN